MLSLLASSGNGGGLLSTFAAERVATPGFHFGTVTMGGGTPAPAPPPPVSSYFSTPAPTTGGIVFGGDVGGGGGGYDFTSVDPNVGHDYTPGPLQRNETGGLAAAGMTTGTKVAIVGGVVGLGVLAAFLL